jgi:nicotinamide mononucleotide transporter
LIPWFEVCANAVNAASIILAARNNIQTWWTGMLGCALFAVLFYNARLYADVLLQGFFISTSAYGWWQWKRGNHGTELPVARVRLRSFAWSVLGAVLVALGYGWLLSRFTNAFAPFVDSLVLAFSVLAQLLMMRRYYESWWLWLVVNTLSVALFGIKGLWVTAALYAAFWVNAVVALIAWRRLIGRPVAGAQKATESAS